MKSLSVADDTPAHSPAVGELVKAQFTADDAWYRAAVTGTTPEGEFNVHYVDYGNVESLPASRIRKLDPSFKQLAPQAQLAKLAYVRVPAIYEEFGREAAIFLRDLVWVRVVHAPSPLWLARWLFAVCLLLPCLLL